MADWRRNSNSGKNRSSRNNDVSDVSSRGGSRQHSDILSKEEEYKRLNAELEAKTASLVQEAELVMREQENVFGKSNMLDNISTEDFLRDYEEETVDDDEGLSGVTSTGYANRFYPTREKEVESRPHSKGSRASNSRPQSGKRPPPGSQKRSKSRNQPADDVAVPDDTFLTSLQQQFSDMSTRLVADDDDFDGDDLDLHDDVMPQAANDMGSEAQIRFLKAKLRVMQEEVDRLSHENHKKEEELRTQNLKLKDIEEERNRLLRTSSAHQNQIEKFKKQAEEAKGKSDSLESQLSALRKDLDQTKRNQKHQESSQSVTEVRLNRALEEIEKYREQLRKAKTSSKDSSEMDKKKVDQLMAENKRLEKQKNELMAGFKKQMKLIDVLKRQKMHIEAAKMMQFSEEEFVKALEWGS